MRGFWRVAGLALALGAAPAWADETAPDQGSKSVKELSPVPRDLIAPPDHLVNPPKDEVSPGQPVNVLEDIMTDDEIFLEFLVLPKESELEPVSPKTNFTGERFELPMDPGALPVPPLDRLHNLVPDQLYRYFDLYLYVNRAVHGTWAQQMFVYEKRNKADPKALDLTKRLSVSTGREKDEKYFTGTPNGLFQLDKTRFYRERRSYQWDGVRIPFAMFFDYAYRHRKSGYAIHAAIPEFEKFLGQRASAGCVRLSMKHGQELFERVQADYAGPVPVFPFDQKVGLTKTDGTIERDKKGHPVMKDGYRVLLIIDDHVQTTKVTQR